jgi:hypothetical protein
MTFSRTPGIRIALLTWLIAMAPYRAGAQLLSDHEVKAAFLVNFAKFTEWPDMAFPDTAGPIVVGVTGDETLRHAIDALARDKQFNGRALKTRNVKGAKDVSDTHVVFIGGPLGFRTTEILRELEGLPVLTVGDAGGFCAAGGMIGFLLEKGRLRFEIRFDATEQAGVKISSRVLALAKTVHGKK